MEIALLWKDPVGIMQDDEDTLEGKTLKSKKAYHLAYAGVIETADPQSTELQSKANRVAAKLTYQFLSSQQIMRDMVYREHIIPKLLGKVPPRTRAERYVALMSAMH